MTDLEKRVEVLEKRINFIYENFMTAFMNFAKKYSSNGYSLTEYELNKALQDFVSGGQNDRG